MTDTYDGKHLTFEEQIELFEKRGMKTGEYLCYRKKK